MEGIQKERRKLGIIGLIIGSLCALLFLGFASPYQPSTENRIFPWLPLLVAGTFFAWVIASGAVKALMFMKKRLMLPSLGSLACFLLYVIFFSILGLIAHNPEAEPEILTSLKFWALILWLTCWFAIDVFDFMLYRHLEKFIANLRKEEQDFVAKLSRAGVRI